MEERKEYCNSCGRKLRIQKGIPREEALIVEHSWGYFRQRTGNAMRSGSVKPVTTGSFAPL